jgi:TPR repeat protein
MDLRFGDSRRRTIGLAIMAEKGDVTAQFHLGAALEGAGEDSQALLWYRKAAEGSGCRRNVFEQN